MRSQKNSITGVDKVALRKQIKAWPRLRIDIAYATIFGKGLTPPIKSMVIEMLSFARLSKCKPPIP